MLASVVTVATLYDEFSNFPLCQGFLPSDPLFSTFSSSFIANKNKGGFRIAR